MARRRRFSPRSRRQQAEREIPQTTIHQTSGRKRSPDGARLDNLTVQRLNAGRDLEREADLTADRIRRGGATRFGVRNPAPSTLTPAGAGQPLQPGIRELAVRGLGLDADRIRVHSDREAQGIAMAAGARAFADGAQIWLGPGEREQDQELMAHELVHVAQGEPGLHLRKGTWLERRAWLSFFDHYLPRKFLNNYMDDSGAAITLSQQEMVDCNPIVNIRRSDGFANELAGLQTQVRGYNAAGTPAPAIKFIEVNGPGQAMTNGTLGNFTIRYKGLLTVTPAGEWVFTGTMEFYDIWDFDPKPFGSSGRSTAGELKTRLAAYGLPGMPFEIFSVPTPLVQTGSDKQAVWAGWTPVFAGDQAGRAGADVEVSGAGGEVGGGVVAGPPGADVGAAGGGELGAQSAEDLNP